MCKSVLRKSLAGLLLLVSLSAFSSDGFWITEEELTELENTFERQAITIENLQTRLEEQETIFEMLNETTERQLSLLNLQQQTMTELAKSFSEYEREARLRRIETAIGSAAVGAIVGAILAAVFF